MTNISLGQTIDGSFTDNDSQDIREISTYFVDKYDFTGLSNWQQVEVSLNPSTLKDAPGLRLINGSTDQVIDSKTSTFYLTKVQPPVKIAFTVYPGVDYKLEAVTIGSGFGGDYTINTNSLGSASSVINLRDSSPYGDTLGAVDALGKFTPIGSTDQKLKDIAISSNSQIFGIKSDFGNDLLYRIEPKSQSTSVVGNLGKDIRWDSLEFAPNNVLYGLGSRSSSVFSNDFSLYTIDPDTAQASLVAKLDPKFSISNLTFDPKRNQFIALGTPIIGFSSNSSLLKDSLFSISLTGEVTKIIDLDFKTDTSRFRDIRGLYFDESNTLFGFNAFDNNNFASKTQRVVINPVTGSVTPDGGLTVPAAAGSFASYSVIGASSIPSATRTTTPTPPAPTPPTPTPTPTPTPPTVVTPTPTPPTVVTPPPTPPAVVTPTPTPPTVVTPTPTPPTVVTPILRTPTPPTPNNTQQPSTNSSSISITSASDLADGDKTLVPGGTIVVSSLATGINNASSNLPGFLRENLKAFLGDNPIPVNFVRISAGSNPLQFDTEINLPNNISPGNYPLKLTLNTDTGSPISAVGPTFDISIPPLGSSLNTPFKIGKLSQSQDTFNFVDSTNTSDFFRFSLTNRSSFNLLLDPQNAGKPSGDATVLLRSTNGQVLEGGIGIQIGKTSFISRELRADDYLIEVRRKPNASDEKIDYNLRTSAIGLTEVENQTLSLKSPSEIEGFVTNDVNEDGLIDKSPKQDENEKKKERLSISISNRNGSPITSIDPKKETWVVVHGNKDSSTSPKMSALADAVAEYKKKQNSNEEPQVLVVDWNQPANNDENSDKRPDLAAEWVNKVAEFAVHSLKDIWGIPANKINLVGHSLGTFVSGLIAEKYLKYTNTGSKINKLILLDSARVLNPSGGDISIARQVFDTEDYDLDGSEVDLQSPPEFSEVATFSRSIWGDFAEGNGLGSPRYNETADESIKVKFKGSKSIIEGRLELSERLVLGDGLTNHGDLVYLFSNILKGEDAISSKLSLDAPLNKEWRNIPGGPEAILEAEKPGDLDANKNDKGAKAATLIAKNPDSSGNDDDIVYGTNENDTLDGFSFDSPVLGKVSRGSLLYSEAGNDIFYGEAGDDQIFGGSGNDTIYGGIGNDFINGQQDNDSIFGGDDNDTIFGAKGEDTIDGGKGNDSLEGNDGKDTLIGGENNDTLWGGGDDSPDSLVGGEGNDYIRGQKGNDTINGDQGNDFINGEEDNDLIDGGDNDDTIFGGKGDDTVIGGKGNDSLEGNDGKDTLIGGEDNDTLWGGGGNWADYLDGGDGNDSLIGEDGDDTLIGGIGKDTLSGGFDSDTFVIRRNEGIRIKDGASREELKNGIDLITDFGTSGFRGNDKIKLIDLSFGDLDFQKLERGFLNPVQDTAIKIRLTGEYLAFLEGVSKDSINKSEFFI